MIELRTWLGGIVLGLAGLSGLFIAAHTHDSGFAFFGFALSLFSVLMLFRLIALVTEGPETHS